MELSFASGERRTTRFAIRCGSEATRLRKTVATIVLCLLVPPAAHSQQPPGIRGFTSRSVSAERDWERKFQALPQPANLREYMQAIADYLKTVPPIKNKIE